jgi:hypothetical protein
MYCLALLKSESINIIGREYLFITILILKPVCIDEVAFSCFSVTLKF